LHVACDRCPFRKFHLGLDSLAESSQHAEIRSLLNDQQQPNFKLLGYLFAAHAGGMIACLSVLKDYKDNLQLKGIGIFVALFGFGLIITALAFVLLAVAIECAYRWIVRDQPKIEPDWLVRDFTASTFEHVGRV
jgi:hypothetical protein